MNKFESNPNNFALDTHIKSEFEIEDESFDEEYSAEENNLNSESLRKGQLSNGSIPVSNPLKTSCSNVVKFETVNNEERFKISEVYIKDYPLKTEIFHEEHLDENIQDGVYENDNIIDYYEKRFEVEEKDFVETEKRFSEITASAPSNNLDLGDTQHKNEAVGYEGNQFKNVDQMEELSAQDLSTIQKRFRCSQCEYQTDHKGDFNKHLPTHLKTKLFKCSECNYECNQKCSLIRHMLTHSKRKLFKCSDCDYECNQKYSLNMHSLTHSNTKLFKCTECEYECNKKYNLKVHLLTHTKTKLFKCPKCVYECNRKGRLKIHILMHSKGML